jgi:hypothetical protein
VLSAANGCDCRPEGEDRMAFCHYSNAFLPWWSRLQNAPPGNDTSSTKLVGKIVPHCMSGRIRPGLMPYIEFSPQHGVV